MRQGTATSQLLRETAVKVRAPKARRTVVLLCALTLCVGCASHRPPELKSRWTNFVEVQGQPEPVPAEWIATPEGKFAQSIRTPNPLPKDSGYRRGMTTQEYFEHLCNSEAGEFIYRTVDNVEGFYFMRPPKRPTDDDLLDRYRLEAPGIESIFQLRPATPEARARIFINPPWARYSFIEESGAGKELNQYLRIFGYRQDVATMRVERVANLKSEYGLIWRGIRRPHDRELAIAGSEWIVVALSGGEVVAILRNYARAAFDRHSKDGTWWLNAVSCPNLTVRADSAQFYDFASKALKPVSGGLR